jgi:hypothetical protein
MPRHHVLFVRPNAKCSDRAQQCILVNNITFSRSLCVGVWLRMACAAYTRRGAIVQRPRKTDACRVRLLRGQGNKINPRSCSRTAYLPDEIAYWRGASLPRGQGEKQHNVSPYSAPSPRGCVSGHSCSHLPLWLEFVYNGCGAKRESTRQSKASGASLW